VQRQRTKSYLHILYSDRTLPGEFYFREQTLSEVIASLPGRMSAFRWPPGIFRSSLATVAKASIAVFVRTHHVGFVCRQRTAQRLVADNMKNDEAEHDSGYQNFHSRGKPGFGCR
jgi:hypothetical protein